MKKPLVAGVFIVLLCVAVVCAVGVIRHNRARRAATLAAAQAAAVDAPADSAKNLPELLPRVLPGDSCEAMRGRLGAETKSNGDSLSWDRDNVSIAVQHDAQCVARSVIYFVKPGRSAMTPDGILLGKDTLGQASNKLVWRTGDSVPAMWQGAGKIHAALDLPATNEFPYASSYDWTLDGDKTKALKRQPVVTDFSTETANSYAIDVATPAQEAKRND